MNERLQMPEWFFNTKIWKRALQRFLDQSSIEHATPENVIGWHLQIIENSDREARKFDANGNRKGGIQNSQVHS